MKFNAMHRNLLTALAAAVFIDVVVVAARPNFVFILTDDQDVHMNSLDYMPEVQEHLIEKGALFDKHYCTISVCCPSRANLWTGQMAHNTNITNVQMPLGGYPKFINNGYNEKHLALWMKDAGYNTYYGGKLFNGQTIKNYNKPHMSGYTDSAFYLEPFAYQYNNVSYTRNGSEPVNPVGEYSTDILANLTQEFIDHAVSEDKPFFITVAPIAPHSWLREWTKKGGSGPPVPADRHKGMFADYKIPRTDNFNPEEPSSVNWIAELDRLNETAIEWNDEFQRRRMRSLMAVDEMVGDIVRRLEKEDVIDNTYIIYSTDNGFHISQHRLHPGKMCGLETDINIPMIIRGPGIEAGSKRSNPSSHSDVAPTILQLAGEDITNKELDGSPMDLGLPEDEYKAPERTEHVAVEFWGSGLGESPFAKNKKAANNTYKGLRIEAEDYGFYYSVWCNNVREMYDMKSDPGQLDNLLSPSRSSDKAEFSLQDQKTDAVADRLDALLMVLKSCKEDTCRDPWATLHPNGDIRSLSDALSTDFDTFYSEQTKIQFEECSKAQILTLEGPQEYSIFGADGQSGDGGDENDEDVGPSQFVLGKWTLGAAVMTTLVVYLL